MKFWLWLILLGAGGSAAYLILSDTSTPSTARPTAAKIEIHQEDQDVEEEPSLPSQASQGPSEEVILPQDQPLKLAHKPTNDALAPKEGSSKDDVDDEADAEDIRQERELLFERPRDIPAPTRRPRNKAGDAAGSPQAPTPSSPAVAAAAPTASAPSAPSVSGNRSESSSGLGGGFGGTFPALPASAPAASPSSTASATGGSGSGKPLVPSTPASNGNAEAAKTARAKPAEEKVSTTPTGTEVAGRETPADEIIKAPSPETQRTEENLNSAWQELMKIPAGFSGLMVTPRTMPALTVTSNLASDAETQPSMLLGATWKSNFDVTDRPTVQILKECPADPAVECFPHQIPASGPFFSDYLYQEAAHQEDMIPDSKDTFEIGCVVVGSQKDANGKDVPQTECAIHVHPGSIPGKYQVVLFTKNVKLTGSFEVVVPSVPSPPETASETAPSPETAAHRVSPASKAGVPR